MYTGYFEQVGWAVCDMFSSFLSNVVVNGINTRCFRLFCDTWVGVRHFATDQYPKIHTERVSRLNTTIL